MIIKQIQKILSHFNITIDRLILILDKYEAKKEMLEQAEYDIVIAYIKLENSINRPDLVIAKKGLDWIDDWYELFPKGKKNKAGHYIKSDKDLCEKKLLKIISKNKQTYTKEIIFQATSRYVKDKENENFEYASKAPFFVEKDGVSILSSYCENLLENDVISNDSFNLEEG
jgi:uncharacterized protein (DUF2344 family)